MFMDWYLVLETTYGKLTEITFIFLRKIKQSVNKNITCTFAFQCDYI